MWHEFRAYMGKDRLSKREAERLYGFADDDDEIGFNTELDLIVQSRIQNDKPLYGLDIQAVRDKAWGYARIPSGDLPPNQQPHNRGNLPGRTHETDAALDRIFELLNEMNVGKAKGKTVGVVLRNEDSRPRIVVGFSGGGENVRSLLRRPVPGGLTVRRRLHNAGFIVGATGMWLLQNTHGYQAMEEFDNRSCAAARCVAGASRIANVDIIGLAENWWGSAPNPHPIQDPNEPPMSHCDTCAANLGNML